LRSISQQNFDRYYTFNTWTNGTQVLEIPGEGFFVVGYNDSLSFDINGQPLLDYYQGIIVKLDYNGDTIKTFQLGNKDTIYTYLYGSNSDDSFRTAVLSDDGNILVGGETQSYNATNYYDYDLWLLKFDPDLNLIFNKQFSLPDSQIVVGFAQGRKNRFGGLVLPGNQQNFSGSIYQFNLSSFDSLGNLIFHQAILPLFNGSLFGVTETSDRGYICVGQKCNFCFLSDLSPIVIKTDSLGNVDWYQILPYSGDINTAYDVVNTQDGNYVYTWGNVVLAPGAQHKVWKMHFTKIDLSGNEIWTKEYGYSFDYLQRIKELPNGNLMLTGWFRDTLAFSKQAMLTVCTNNGDTLWSRKFSGDPVGNIKCMDGGFTSDGGFILTGETYCCNFTPNLGWTSSLWVLKTDSLGLITSVINLPKPELNLTSLSAPYPNPTSNKCTITTLIPPGDNYMSGSDYYILVFDLLGRQLEKIKITYGLIQTILDFSMYENGEYVIALSINGFNAGTKKVIKE